MVPVFNEEEAVPVFLTTIRPVLETLGLTHEIVFVDDGSCDRTVEILRMQAVSDPVIRLVRLSRNFGKEAALTAGLDHARGDAVITIDVDLQDPPAMIADFVRLWQEGYDVVYGQRIDRASDTAPKRATAGLFYWVFNQVSTQPIEPNAGDFRLMSRPVVEATRLLRERNRFMKGLFAWVGYRSIGVPYTRTPRAAGVTKFNYWKLWNFALDGVTSFSTAPLRIWTYVGISIALLAVIYMAVILFQTLIFGRDVPGYASLMMVILMLGAVQIVSLGIMGEYIGRLYMEAKRRPVYLVQEVVESEATASDHADSVRSARPQAHPVHQTHA